jgi:hypothetical protein
MNFNITTNKELDIAMVEEFYSSGTPIIHKYWPMLNNTSQIPALVEAEYGPKLEAKVTSLRADIPKLKKITKAISDVVCEEWAPINTINIYLGACPVAPRFIDVHSFLLPYYHDKLFLMNTSAHEMIHFLYFKKWASFFPTHKAEDFEYPNPVWVLSEILVAVIGNDRRIKKVVGSKFNIYENWREFKFEGKNLLDLFTDIYRNSKSFDVFLTRSWEKYQVLDKSYDITKKLVDNPF